MKFRVQAQLTEALGQENRWYCSQAHGRKVDDPEMLIKHFIRSGGAADFDRRFALAMGDKNRWYCSQFYNREIQDPEILWTYFMDHINDGKPSRLCHCS